MPRKLNFLLCEPNKINNYNIRNVKTGNICKIKNAATAQASVLLNIIQLDLTKN